MAAWSTIFWVLSYDSTWDWSSVSRIIGEHSTHVANGLVFLQNVNNCIISYKSWTQFSSIWPIDRTLSGATTPGQSKSGSDDNEGVLHIPQNSNITGTSPSDSLVLYSGHSLEKSYTSAEMQSVYSRARLGELFEYNPWINTQSLSFSL